MAAYVMPWQNLGATFSGLTDAASERGGPDGPPLSALPLGLSRYGWTRAENCSSAPWGCRSSVHVR